MQKEHPLQTNNDITNDLPLFMGLSTEAREALLDTARMHRLRASDKLFAQGDITRAYYTVLKGGVRLVENTEEGKQINLKIYGPGDIFGLLSLAGEFVHRADVVAVGRSEILAFDAQQTRELAHQYPDITLRIIDLLVLHVEHAHERIRALAVEKTERRLARSLLHFCTKFGDPGPDNTLHSSNFTQQDLAEFTGTTVETVNRLLREWEKRGMIKRRRMQITISNVAQLRALAQATPGDDRGYTANAVP